MHKKLISILLLGLSITTLTGALFLGGTNNDR